MRPAHHVDVWWAEVGDADEVDAQRAVAVRLLPEADTERLEAVVDPRAAAVSVLAGLLLRFAVGAATGRPWTSVEVRRHCHLCGGGHGKPVVAGVEVSVAHSEGVALVAVTAGPRIGIDLEMSGRRDVEPVVDLLLSGAEERELGALPAGRRSAAVLRWWTRKEAVLKMTGEGLAADPRRVVVSGPDLMARLISWDDRDTPADRVTLLDLDLSDVLPHTVASLAVDTHDPVEVRLHAAPTHGLGSAPLGSEASWAG